VSTIQVVSSRTENEDNKGHIATDAVLMAVKSKINLERVSHCILSAGKATTIGLRDAGQFSGIHDLISCKFQYYFTKLKTTIAHYHRATTSTSNQAVCPARKEHCEALNMA
jgi:hypothetical protein